MESEQQIKNLITDTYQRTLELATNITKNRFQFFDEEISKEHVKFIKKISKSFRDYRNLSRKPTKGLKNQEKLEKTSAHVSGKPKESKKFDKGNKAKSLLDGLIEESYKLAKDTKSGKSGFRNMTPSPPPVIERIRNKSIMSDSDSDEKPSTYVNCISGKTEDIQLPSFKEYLKENKGNSENEKMFKKIEKCQVALGTFEKKINGLEYFCKFNPGVPWNNDKGILMKLAGNQQNKSALIKAYNEKHLSVGSRSSKRTSIFTRLHSLSPDKKISPKMPSISEKPQTPKPRLVTKRNNSKIDYLSEIQQAKIDLHTKTVKIFNKIKEERPSKMRDKASLILKDQEKFRGRIKLFKQMDSFKRIVESNKYQKLTKCKSQVKLYTSLLDYLKHYKGLPTPEMIIFVEALKDLLEGGRTITQESLENILQGFEVEKQLELEDLVKIVEKFLNR
jgi:hypothetical protein